ncbi:MAG: PKD domain-containing protein [Fimbriimonadaceae bacterium]|nr:PKD domain-containing protein [Fimbriimonadaceae bacterium]
MWLWRTALLTLLLLPAAAADLDHDGLSDEQEALLGSDPAHAEVFETIHDDRSRAAGDRTVSDDPRRDITTVAVAPVGGQRFIWRITFAADYQPHSVLHLYLDVDGDPRTGRQNGTGTDAMLSQTDGAPHSSGFAATGEQGAGPAARLVVAGPQVYLSGDLPLRQLAGRSRYRLMVLSEQLDPHTAADQTVWLEVDAPPASPRPLPKLDSDRTSDEGFRPFRGLPQILALQERSGTVAVSIRQAQLSGFVEDTFTEYRGVAAVRRGGVGSSVSFPIPRAGRYWLGVQQYDGPGAEVFAVLHNDRPLGYVSGTADCRDLVLHGSLQPVVLQAGDQITLRLAAAAGESRLEELLLLPAAPPVWQPRYEIRHTTLWADQLTFTTTWPVAAEIRLRDRSGKLTTVVEERATQNHRVALTAAQAAVIAARTPGGQTVLSKSLTVQPRHPAAAKGAGAARRSVPLTLSAGGPLPAVGWPVTSGVPLPPGDWWAGQDGARLLGDGQVIDAQCDPTVWWPDGSVRWLLLRFTARPRVQRYVLEYGRQVADRLPAAPWPPGATARYGHLGVTAAGIGYDLNGDQELGADELTVDLRHGGLAFDGADRGGPAPVTARRQEFGAARGRVVVSGTTTPDAAQFGWELDAELFAEVPVVRLYHTITNADPRQLFSTLRRWSLPLTLRGATAQLGDAAGQPGSGLSLRQVDDTRYELQRGGQAAGSGHRAAGWAAVDLPGGPAAVIPRAFWQHWPKGLAVDAQGVRLDLLPDIRDVAYGTDWYDPKKPDHRLYYCFEKGAYKLKLGCSKRQELWLTWGIAPAVAAALVEQPPLLVASPAWYQQSRAFGEISINTQQVYPSYEPAMDRALDAYLASREQLREYGFLNFGDWYGERGTNWGNIEYDTQHAMLMQFARGGQRRWFDVAEQAERHNMDVDTVWAGPNAGLVYAHCLGHVGHYLSQPVGQEGTAGGGFTASHTWCEGHCEYAALTGDERALTTARMIADAYARKTDANYDYTNGRDSGWHLLFTLAVYEYTGDPYYLNCARLIVDRVVERQTPNGGWDRMMVPGHCLCEPPRHRGEAGFMVGVLLSGLKAYHQLEPDPRIPPLLYRASKWLIRDMWTPAVKGFRYTSCPHSSAGGPWSNPLLFEGIAYANRFHPDPAVEEVLRVGCEAAYANISAFGKGFSQQSRCSPRILWDMERLAARDRARGLPTADAGPDRQLADGAGDRITLDGTRSRDLAPGKLVRYEWDLGDGRRLSGARVVATFAKAGSYPVVLTVTDNAGLAARDSLLVTVAPAWVRALDPRSLTRIEAEAFTAQGGGAVRVERGRIAASGAMVTGWHAELGHWLEWTLPVAVAGRYRLALRYCSDSPQPRRKVELNGQVPRPDLATAGFARTGGFCTATDDWQLALLGGAEQPVTLDLPAGPAQLRLTNLGDGMGLDYLLLIRQP